MLTESKAKSKLLGMLKDKSVFRGDYVLSSGAKSNYYVDCKLTTLDSEGACLVGQVLNSLIRHHAERTHVKVDAIGGLTMGADPIALAVGIHSFLSKEHPPLRTFIVRKTPKLHGQTKLIEGNFRPGDSVVVIDDVVTKGDSTINAIDAVEKEGGKVAFVVVLVDRQQGGREKIEARGHQVVAAFTRDELLKPDVEPHQKTDCVPA